MKKKPNITDEERAIFKDYAKGIKPLKPSATEKLEPTAKKHAKSRFSPRQLEPDIERLQTDDVTPFVASQDALQFARTGVQYRVIQQMRRGDIAINATLDLHGMTTDQAEEALSSFLTRAVERQWRYVLVIHGKGTYRDEQHPILKNKVNQWLRAHTDVLAFCSANPYQGGVGAVYVLLRRSR